MKNKRLTGFVLAILGGLVLGLIYGWFINPPDARNTSLDSLRSDYQADYVLMVAEKYSTDQDALTASALLQKISSENPQVSIKQAQILGQQLGYSELEMQLLSDLEAGLTASANTPDGVTP